MNESAIRPIAAPIPAAPVAKEVCVRLAVRAGRLAMALLATLALAVPGIAAAQAPEDLPGRVGRVADVAGELFLAPQDKPEAWTPAGLNYPVTSGDNLWLAENGRAEIDVGGAQVRMGGSTSVHVSQLTDHRFALFVAQGRVSLRVRAVDPGDVAIVDTPNSQVAITRPGLYRIDVTEDRQRTVVIVREGEANVQTQAAVQQVLPGQAAYIEGADPQYASVQNGIWEDGFDSWVASRDRLYRVRGNDYVSPQMVGAADLDRYGTWQQMPEYGAMWYPNDVPADWAPYRNGYWVDVGTWGPTWVDAAPWGYAPFHYGRWAFVGGRWGWAPGVYTARPLWAPALVAWTGGAGWSVSVTTGGPVYGWVPLAWGEPFRPWWGRCSAGCWDRFNRPYAVNVAVVRPWSPPPQRWRNASAPGGVTAVPFQAFQSRQPVSQNLVRVTRDSVAAAPVLAAPPVMRGSPTPVQAQRPGMAPPPASTFQPALARPMPVAPAGAAPQRGSSAQVPAGSIDRARPGAPGATPGAVSPMPPGQRGTVAAPTSPSSVQRDGRPPSGAQPVAPGYAQPPGSSPVTRGQPQPSVPTSSGAQPYPPAQGRPGQTPPGQMQPSPGAPSPGAAPVARQPQMAPPSSQPTQRGQPQPSLQPQAPMARPQGLAPAQAMPSPQAAPAAQPMSRPQPMPQQAQPMPPQAQPAPAPSPRAQPAPAAAQDPGRPAEGGNLSRGAR